MATFPTSLVLLAACYLLIGDHVSAYSNLVPRFHHTMEIVNGQLCVFGGKSVSTYTNISDYLLDYRCVDITKPIQQARPHWNVLSSASQFAMPPLAQHTSVYNRKSHVIIPYGGQSPYMFSANDIFSIFCTKFQAWDASTTHNTVPRRYLHTAVLQESSGDMIVFGGASDPTTDTQEYSRWTNPARVVTDPALHSAHAALVGNTTNNVPVGHITIDHGDAVPENVTLITHHSSILVNDTHMVVLGGNRCASPSPAHTTANE
ncbi:hypothetical protein GQ54DRAFT_305764 [Martensiomyces pterosporus]|nr:hypothetical protein GQ54DRAFT_305764 [Martensiomyces pterosporus]